MLLHRAPSSQTNNCCSRFHAVQRRNVLAVDEYVTWTHHPGVLRVDCGTLRPPSDIENDANQLISTHLAKNVTFI